MVVSSITRFHHDTKKGTVLIVSHNQGVAGTMFSFNYNGGSGLQLSNTDYSMFVSIPYFPL